MKLMRAPILRDFLFVFSLFASGHAFADGDCGGVPCPPVLPPMEVTDTREPLPTCEELGICPQAPEDPVLLAGGGIVVLPRSSETAGIERFFKGLPGFCKKSTESCNDWNLRVSLEYCRNPKYISVVTHCNIFANDQGSIGCPHVMCPSV